MAIANGQALILEALYKSGHWHRLKSVCELGAQVPLPLELVDFFAAIDLSPPVESYTAKELYAHLGIWNYESIDFNGIYGALRFDLNHDLAERYQYTERFDLVTNFGTSAVVFDQSMVFRNIHRLCKKGGYMAHTLPAQGWATKWFYKYSTCFIPDIAAANDYEIVFMRPFLRLKPYLKNGDISMLQNVFSLCRFVEDQLAIEADIEPLTSPIDLRTQQIIDSKQDIASALAAVAQANAMFNITFACVLRKTNDREFQIPVLEMYRKENKAVG